MFGRPCRDAERSAECDHRRRPLRSSRVKRCCQRRLCPTPSASTRVPLSCLYNIGLIRLKANVSCDKWWMRVAKAAQMRENTANDEVIQRLEMIGAYVGERSHIKRYGFCEGAMGASRGSTRSRSSRSAGLGWSSELITESNGTSCFGGSTELGVGFVAYRR